MERERERFLKKEIVRYRAKKERVRERERQELFLEWKIDGVSER